MSRRPVIGITPDTAAPGIAAPCELPGERCSPREKFRYESPGTYARAVAAAGGVPIILPYHLECIGDYLALCDGFILSGGDDPDTTPFGEPVHPAAKLMHPLRQQFETALLAALDHTPHPVLGICLGMQLMALHHGGKLHQHLPAAPGIGEQFAAEHYGREHAIEFTTDDSDNLPGAGAGIVASKHHQAVADPGKMRTVAVSDAATGRVIEAIDAPQFRGRYYLGVQWHPERTADEALGLQLIKRFVESCKVR